MREKWPLLSILIATKNSSKHISLCLESIEKQYRQEETEVIVADASTDSTASIIEKRFQWVRIFSCDSSASSADLKSKAILESRGDIVALTEPHCIVDENWVKSIIKAHESSYSIISGAVEPKGIIRLTDWAAFFCEYGPFLLPITKGKHNEMAGNNISYKRNCLSKYNDDISRNGFWKAFIHSRMMKNGESMLTDPTVIVYHNKKVSFLAFLRKRYYYGRCFGGMRIKGMEISRRVLYILLSTAIPFLYTLRSAKNVIPKKRFLKEYLLSFPLLFLLFISWAYGEFCGYLFGVGASCREVYD